jgi:hypothetical protein
MHLLGLKQGAPQEVIDSYAEFCKVEEDYNRRCFPPIGDDGRYILEVRMRERGLGTEFLENYTEWLNEDTSEDGVPIHLLGLKQDAPPEAVDAYDVLCSLAERFTLWGLTVVY